MEKHPKESNKKRRLIIAGSDEAGRGPLAGPVLAGAVILNPRKPIKGLADSKILTERQREELFELIKERSLAWSFGRAEVEEIDSINILHASMLAMQRAVAALSIIPDLVKVDGNRCPELTCAVEAYVDGDKLIPEISAASIVAKVIRDREMVEWDQVYPQYGFASHKGYATPEHLYAIRQHGVIDLHRKSFEPVRLKLEQMELELE